MFIFGLLGAGAAVVAFLHRFSAVEGPMAKGFISMVTKSPEERAADLLTQYREENSKLYADLDQRPMIAPRIRMLRVGLDEDGLRCLFLNEGGPARELQVEPTDGIIATLSPLDELASGQTGSIHFSDFSVDPRSLRFNLLYKDSTGLRVVRSYKYSYQDQRFIEV